MHDTVPDAPLPGFPQGMPPEIPKDPGVYLFKDGSGRILYVGKAKSLVKRLGSYFRDYEGHAPKTRAMLRVARSLDTLVTATEKEALLLEASLIKKHRPRYNIVLRDDKQYVLFKLSLGSDYPRLSLTRRVVSDGSVYHGPFTSARAAREALKAIHRVFPLRRCKDTVFRNRVRPCLYHHIGLCLGPCVGGVDQDLYAAMVKRVRLLLSGRSRELTEELKQEMARASEELRFEDAAELRDQIRAVHDTLQAQAVVLPTATDMDVVGLSETEQGLALSVLFVRQGRLLDKTTFVFTGRSLTDGQEAVATFLLQYYAPGAYVPPAILLPFSPEREEAEEGTEAAPEDSAETSLETALAERRGAPVRLKTATSSTEKRLIGLARDNARRDAQAKRGDDVLESIARRLKLPGRATRVECVDVSHTGGAQARVGMVVFQEGKPEKSEYRLYKVAEGGDDYAALAEWAERRIKAGPPWPDLVLIDGGKGQLAAVARVLDEALANVPEAAPGEGDEAEEADDAPRLLPLASIAKARDDAGRTLRAHANQADRIFLPNRKNPVELAESSRELLFLQHVRDTAHDYVIGRHRKARQKATLTSGLLGLPGVGPATAKLLWERFGSLSEMAAAGPEQLAKIPGIGQKKAQKLSEELAKLVQA